MPSQVHQSAVTVDDDDLDDPELLAELDRVSSSDAVSSRSAAGVQIDLHRRKVSNGVVVKDEHLQNPTAAQCFEGSDAIQQKVVSA